MTLRRAAAFVAFSLAFLRAGAASAEVPWAVRLGGAFGLASRGAVARSDLVLRLGPIVAGPFVERADQLFGYRTAGDGLVAGARAVDERGFTVDLLASGGRHRYARLGTLGEVDGALPFAGARLVVEDRVFTVGPVFFAFGAEAFAEDDLTRKTVVEHVPRNIAGRDQIIDEGVAVGFADVGILVRIAVGFASE